MPNHSSALKPDHLIGATVDAAYISCNHTAIILFTDRGRFLLRWRENGDGEDSKIRDVMAAKALGRGAKIVGIKSNPGLILNPPDYDEHDVAAQKVTMTDIETDKGCTMIKTLLKSNDKDGGRMFIHQLSGVRRKLFHKVEVAEAGTFSKLRDF